MSESIPQAIGVIGMICVVYAYLAMEKGWLNRDNPRYYLINLAGATLLTFSLIFKFNLGSILIEMFWIWISVAGLLRIRKKQQK